MRYKLYKIRKFLIAAVILLLILAMTAVVLFVPYNKDVYDDGGTVVYTALTYKKIHWKRACTVIGENGEAIVDGYQKTVVYWYPDSQKSYDELWETELEGIK